VDEEVLALLQSYDWPGNLRELEVVLRQAVERAVEPLLHARDFPRRLKRPSSGLTEDRGADGSLALPLDQVLDRVERRLFDLAMQRFRGNKSKAADFLGITRARFHRRWEQWQSGGAARSSD
jgi:DNA-binding NtrC family response regulator